jgi:hypothetical protein
MVSTGIVDGVGAFHLAVCRRFGEAVRAAQGKWNRRSPCDAWDARGVLEHVIGFHDVLLLRPLNLKPDRPRDDPQLRWEMTYGQLTKAFNRDTGIFERIVDIPAVANTLHAMSWCIRGTSLEQWGPMIGSIGGGASISTLSFPAIPRR